MPDQFHWPNGNTIALLNFDYHHFSLPNMLTAKVVPVQIPSSSCDTVAFDLRLGVAFCQVLQFPPLVTTGLSRLSCNMAEKVTKI